MSSAQIINNRFDGKDYRVSIIPVRKKVSVSSPWLNDKATREMARANGMLRPMQFDNIIFEAAIFPKKKFFKPLFSIELDDGYSKKMTEEEFTKWAHVIVENEKIEDLINGELDMYKKYGFFAVARDMWQLFFLSKTRIVFIFKDPRGQ